MRAARETYCSGGDVIAATTVRGGAASSGSNYGEYAWSEHAEVRMVDLPATLRGRRAPERRQPAAELPNQEINRESDEAAGEEEEDAEEEMVDAEAKARILPTPRMPGKEARRRHVDRGHCPYQPWCRICVQCRGISSPHRTTQGGAEEREIPTISMDYCFPDGRGRGEEGGEEHEQGGTEEQVRGNTILVAREGIGGPTLSLKVPRKGAAYKKVLDYIVQWIRCQGAPRVKFVIKSDSEPSMKQVQDDLRGQNKDLIIIPENTPVGDSASNGIAERAVEEVHGYIRTLVKDLEEHIGFRVTHDMPIYHWLVRHVGTILTRVKVHSITGLTAYERMKRKPSHAIMMPIGEAILYQASAKARTRRSADRFKEGIYLGISWRSEEVIVGTPEGVTLARSVRRNPEERKWNAEMVRGLRGTPLDVKGQDFEEDDINPEDMSHEKGEGHEEKARSRNFHIRRQDLDKHGPTDGCPGCSSLLRGQCRALHLEACRRRFEEEMLKDPETAERVARGLERMAEEWLGDNEHDERQRDEQEDRGPKKQGEGGRQPGHGEQRQRDGDEDEGATEDAERAKRRRISSGPRAGDEDVFGDEFEEIIGEGGEGTEEEAIDRTRKHEDIDEDTDNKRRRVSQLAVVTEVEKQPKVAEIYSMPRIAQVAEEMGMQKGSSMDIRNGWDFSRADHRHECRRRLKAEEPDLVIGSPMCTMFSVLQNLNPGKDTEEWNRAYAEAVLHINFCVEVYRDQMARGAYFLHENPAWATSWQTAAIRGLNEQVGVITTIIDMCQYGLETSKGSMRGPARKPTKMMTNAPMIAQELRRRCPGRHNHIPLMSGRAGPCAEYPLGLCRAVCKGLINQAKADREGARLICSMMNENGLEEVSENDWVWDDAKGGWLNPRLVMEARAKEIEYVKKMGLYEKVPREVAHREGGGRKPIKVRWVDTNKGNGENPNYRSRLVAMEFKVDNRPDLYSATPPLECFKMVCALAASEGGGGAGTDPTSIMHIDISRAYFHAPVTRRTFIELPDEDKDEHGEAKVGRLCKSMYGTRDAQLNWERTFTEVLTRAGFDRGVAVPCSFYSKEFDIRVVVHGDDFMATGRESGLIWLRDRLAEKLEVKAVIIGPGPKQDKMITILNRQVVWGEEGITWKADEKHAHTIIRELGFEESNGVATPSTEEIRDLGNRRATSQPLTEEKATIYRRLVATANFLAADRPDIQFTVRCLCQGMSNPTEADMQALRHFGRYLRRLPAVEMTIPWGVRMDQIIAQSDSDWAGDKCTRKSTSGGALFAGGALLKSWSKLQAPLATSSGEAELYAAATTAKEALGIQSILKEMGVHAEIELQIDAAATEGMLQRRGLGRMRHIEVSSLWIQGAIADGKFRVRRIPGKENCADLGTKPLSRASMETHMTNMGFISPKCKRLNS